jgi:hypothetical protein
MLGGDLPRLALQAITEDHAFVAGCFCARLRSAQRVGRPRDDLVFGPGKECRARFRRFVGGIGKAARDSFRHLEPIFADDRARSGERRWIRHGRPGTDNCGIVAGDVGDRQRYHRCGLCALSEAPAFNA